MKMHDTKISLPEKKRLELASILNETLASIIDLQLQLKQAHWNVKGMQFIAIHKLLDELAENVESHVDIVAERITSLGGTAYGTLQRVAANTELNLYPTDIFLVTDHIEHLAHNFAILGELSRKNIDLTAELNDMVSNEIYISLTGMLDKNLWFLEAHLQI